VVLQRLAQLDLVKNMVRGPALQKVFGHPRPPADLQQLGQVKTVDRHHNEGACQHGKHLQLFPKHRRIPVLQSVVEDPVPVVEQDQHIDHAQVQTNASDQQGTRRPAFFRAEIRQGQKPHIAQMDAGFAPHGANGVEQSHENLS
jgi:hypothetical protein